jgi:hypothetical protein
MKLIIHLHPLPRLRMIVAVFVLPLFSFMAWVGKFVTLTLNLLTTTIVAPPSNASKWQMGFNSVFKGLRGNIDWWSSRIGCWEFVLKWEEVTRGWKDYWNQVVKKCYFARNPLKTNELRSLCTTHERVEVEDMKKRGNLEDLGYVEGR